MNRNQFILNLLTVVFSTNFYNTNCVRVLTPYACKLVGNYKKYFKGHSKNISVFYNNLPICHIDNDFAWVLQENIPEFIDTSKIEFSTF